MISLPIIEEPFSRIVLVCYPKVAQEKDLRSTDAEHIAEELVTVFSRVGVPREMLTDQGSNFTLQLLKELYRLLHIHPIRTSPYHPQTDLWKGLTRR